MVRLGWLQSGFCLCYHYNVTPQIQFITMKMLDHVRIVKPERRLRLVDRDVSRNLANILVERSTNIFIVRENKGLL
jgi:hypothetical protein